MPFARVLAFSRNLDPKFDGLGDILAIQYTLYYRYHNIYIIKHLKHALEFSVY